MKQLLVLLLPFLFCLQPLSGQISVRETNRNLKPNDDSLSVKQERLLIKFGHKAEGMINLVNREVYEVYNDSLSASKEKLWLSINDFRRKKYTQKDFQHIPFEHFLKTLPIVQR